MKLLEKVLFVFICSTRNVKMMVLLIRTILTFVKNPSFSYITIYLDF